MSIKVLYSSKTNFWLHRWASAAVAGHMCRITATPGEWTWTVRFRVRQLCVGCCYGLTASDQNEEIQRVWLYPCVVTDCRPMIDDLDIFVAHLQKTLDWHRFIVSVRQGFKQLVWICSHVIGRSALSGPPWLAAYIAHCGPVCHTSSQGS